MRRAFTQVRNGRPRPVLVEFPVDLWNEDVAEPLNYKPALRMRSAPDPKAVAEVARVLIDAERPVIYAGQGVHYAKAWPQLRQLAELLEAPVTTSLQGKSAFPENHPLSLGSGGRSISKQLHHFLTNADVIFGIGCSFTTTNYGVAMPKGKTSSSTRRSTRPTSTRTSRSSTALIGDAGLTLDALIAEVKDRLKGKPRGRLAAVTAGDQDAQGRVAGQVDAAAHADVGAAVAVPRDLGPDAHGGRRQHDHHPRRRAARATSSRPSGSRPRR